MGLSTNVFISYAADTLPLAEELTRVLQQEGITAWTDFKDLKPGQLWKEEIERAVEDAHSFVVLISPRSKMTRWAEWECRQALTKAWSDSSKMMIPVIVGGDEPPPFLRDWVALRVDPELEPARWTAEILQVLRSANDGTVAATP